MLDTTERQTLTIVLCSLRILKQSSYHTWCCVIGDLAFSRDSGFLGSNLYHLEFPNECLFIYGGPLEKYFFEPPFFGGVGRGKNAGVGCHSLLQDIFLTQGLNPDLLPCKQMLYCLSHQGSPGKYLIVYDNEITQGGVEESISSSAFNLLYGPTLTSIHDYWKDHSLDYTDLCWQSNVSAF